MSTGRKERPPGRRAGQVSAILLESLYAALGFWRMILVPYGGPGVVEM
jgi:hypothetical protein